MYYVVIHKDIYIFYLFMINVFMFLYIIIIM